jgi:hypothetical protein
MIIDFLLGIRNKIDRKWYHIIGWWEIRRLPYNILVFLVGLISIQIAYISIPLIYILVGLGLNILYCFGWIIDLNLTMTDKAMEINKNHSRRLFLIYLTFSLVVIGGLAILLILG